MKPQAPANKSEQRAGVATYATFPLGPGRVTAFVTSVRGAPEPRCRMPFATAALHRSGLCSSCGERAR